MPTCYFRLAIRLMMVAAFLPSTCELLFSQTGAEPPRSTASVPDLTGIWDQPRGTLAGYDKPGFSITREDPPMTAWAAEQWKAIREGPKRNRFDRGNENMDPSYTHCLPF